MFEGERRDPSNVGGVDRPALAGKLIQSGLDIGGVPQRDDIEDQAKGAKLLFLSLPIGPFDLTAFAVADAPGQPVPEFMPVQLRQDTPPRHRHVWTTAAVQGKKRSGLAMWSGAVMCPAC